MRIDKFLHDQQFGTRAQIHEIIKQRRVLVNGQVVKAYKQSVTLDDQVAVDGQIVGQQTVFYYLMNKPSGVITATNDATQKTVMDLFATDDQRSDLFPVGRLDKDTTGALVITNDGQLAHRLVSPKSHVGKLYETKVTGKITAEQLQSLQAGIVLKNGDQVTAESTAIVAQNENETTIKIVLHQGKYHQVKRMFGALGQRVIQLDRLAFAGLTVNGLAAGEYRELTDEEIKMLNE
ncbi:pseudouridine synthase [Paucilactobacillus hokkaidonensis JCM 18461]|uniref:Pseudouridine synthase n=3 Tax=Paucilactobacillus hokkaidonensis TaxID=1193095 RepID=A0A0A1GY24_9LACO|nr:pseudouridine synthase [Paucilactobacillus hokkaidonensis]KRO10122.1 pseudouridylate synthase [Paucilactobacillus hokkaidonensis]BAP85366.1 pseudouridine synthase [Paucilactobacillus hokkaidonensis JCM 18461]